MTRHRKKPAFNPLVNFKLQVVHQFVLTLLYKDIYLLSPLVCFKAKVRPKLNNAI